jgi:hypothetical protein
MPLQSSLIHLGLAKEVTQGTAVVPTVWIPVENNIKDEDVIKWIQDKSLRGAPVANFGEYQGPMSSAVDWDANFYPDTLGHVLMALMGTDTLTGAAAPYSHAFTLAQGQPPSYTQSVYNAFNERQYPGTMLDELQLKWAMGSALVASTKWVGWPSAVGTTSAPTIGTNAPFLPWQTAVTIGGAVNPRVIGFDFTAKRKGDVQFALNNSQKPAFTYVGPIDVSCKATFAIEDDTELTYMLSATQPSLVLALTEPSTNFTLTIQMSKANFQKKTPSYSKDYVEVDYDITAVANATDAGAGSPISPVKFTLVNAQSTAY